MELKCEFGDDVVHRLFKATVSTENAIDLN
jgi:hypothetical protein